MDVCGAWPFNRLGCKHELFSYTYMSKNASLYKCACFLILLDSLLYIFSHSLSRMELVWFPHLKEGRKLQILRDYCAPGGLRALHTVIESPL